MTESPNYYAIITAEVRYCKDLPPNAKLLYGEITALANKEGYCWASNEYFANLYDVHKSTISSWVSKLAKLGFIRLEITKNGDQMERKIFLKSMGGVSEITDTPTRKHEHNNTLNSTKESKSHCSAVGETVKTPTVQEYQFIESLFLQERKNEGIEFNNINFPLHRKHQKNLMKKYTLDQIRHIALSFFALRQKEAWWKKHPVSITSLSSNLIDRILTAYPFPVKEKTQMDKLIEIEQNLKTRTK